MSRTMLSGANVLVTGGAGFVGANLVTRLLDLGAHVRATLHHKPAAIDDARVEYIRADITEPQDCAKACADMDYVFLCAAVTSGANVMEHTPLVHLTPNVIMNARMLEAAYAAGAQKVLFISSSTVYPAGERAMAEEDANYEFFDKYFVVAWMKRFSELMAEMYAAHIPKRMKTVVVRPANIYGPLDDFEWDTCHVLPALIRRTVERHDPIAVWGDGLDVKDFIYVDDFIDGMLLAMEKTQNFDVVNIASGRQYVLRDVLNAILAADGYEDARVEFDPTRPKMIPKRLISTAKARRLLGFEANTPIEAGLAKTIEWYRSTL